MCRWDLTYTFAIRANKVIAGGPSVVYIHSHKYSPVSNKNLKTTYTISLVNSADRQTLFSHWSRKA